MVQDASLVFEVRTHFILYSSSVSVGRPRGLMDMASDFESGSCGFESHRGQIFLSSIFGYSTVESPPFLIKFEFEQLIVI